MEKISEGPDLDRAVAEAIGLVCQAKVLGSDVQFFSDPRDPLPGLRVFQPSTDLNDAFHAAELTGLFDEWTIGKFSNPPRSGWGIEGDDSPDCNLYDTPALAICAAILKVLGK